MEKIGVCIVTYNHEKYIGQAIESVLSQNCPVPVIIYIGNDASTDGTTLILQEYAFKYPDRIVLINQPHNVGLVQNTIDLFRRIEADECDYTAILDGDDYWCDDNKLAKQLEYFKNNPKCGLVHTNISLLFGNKLARYYRDNVPSGDVSTIANSVGIGNCSVVFKTELLEKLNFDDFITYQFMSVDYVMYIILAQYTEFGFMTDITAVWRRGHTSVSNTNDMHKQIDYLQNGVRMWHYLDDLYGGVWI